MIRLEESDVTFASNDVLDKDGRVFYWKNDVYRALTHNNSQLYIELLSNKEFTDLFQKGLVETSIADLELQEYELVLKHNKIAFISYVTEWSGSMLKEAALVTINLSRSLIDLNLQLKDAHPWNVLFEGCQPIYIDFSSIIRKRQSRKWFPLEEFWGKFYLPLLLMSYGCAREARTLLIDPETLRGRNVTRYDVLKVLVKRLKIWEVMTFLFEVQPRYSNRSSLFLDRLKHRIDKITIPFEKTHWSDYCDEEVDISTLDTWMTKRRETYFVITRTQPKTLLDIGSNTGWFSKLAAQNGVKVIAFDNDEPSINKLFSNEGARSLGILPLSMDFRFPTHAYGLGLRCQDATKRFQAEMVLALAVVHHLVFKQKASFETIASNLASYTTKWLLVEFIPKEDIYVSEWYNESFAWYTLENFIVELRNHFREIEVLPSNPEPRVLILCTR